MADVVEIKNERGLWELRTIENITHDELKCEMRCCGRNRRGELCHATMTPVGFETVDGKRKHFKRKSGTTPHICGCKFDESGDYTYVARVDTRAEGFTAEDLWKSIKKKPKGGKGKGGGGGGPGGGVSGVPGGDKGRISKPIKKTLRLPNALMQYIEVLGNLRIEDHYADALVRDLIIDKRTVEYHRHKEIPEGKPIFILAKKLAFECRIFEADKYEYVLVDAGYDAAKEKEPTNCLQFRFKLHGEASKKFRNCLKLANRTTYIAMFARLYRDTEHDNTYFVRGLDESRFGVVRLGSGEE